MNLPLPSDAVKRALARAWEAEGPPASVPMERIAHLAAETYGSEAWTHRL